MSNPQKPQEPQKLSAGEILKATRVSKGISLMNVHDATKIPLDALKAVEEGYKVRSLSPFYIKGFIKMYAQYLGVEVADVREDYHKEQLPKVIKKVDAAEAFENNFNRILSRDRQKLIVQIVAGLLVLFIVVKIGGCIRGQGSKTSSKSVKAAQAPSKPKAVTPKKSSAEKKKQSKSEQPTKVEKKESPPTTTSQAVTPPAPQKEESSSTQETKNVRLTVKPRKNGWLQVKVDGNVVFQSAINQGAVESWEAQKIIELSGKNIHNLEFEVNGRVLGTLGREDRNARRVIITKDGLSVKE